MVCQLSDVVAIMDMDGFQLTIWKPKICKREQKQFIVFRNIYCFNKLQAFSLSLVWFYSVFYSHFFRFIGH